MNSESQWGIFNEGGQLTSACGFRFGVPAILHRYVSFDGMTEVLRQDYSYSTTWDPNNLWEWTNKQTTVTTVDLVRGGSFQTVYTYGSIAENFPSTLLTEKGIKNQIPVETSVQYYDQGNNLLRTVTKGWYNQFRLACALTTLDSGQTSGTFYTYGFGMEVADEKEYDYGLITTSACPAVWVTGTTQQPSVTPSRETATAYQSFPNSPVTNAPTIFDRPCQTILYDHGIRGAETDKLYDGGATVCGATGAASTAVVSNLPPGTHDETNYPPSYSNRGNLTTVIRDCFSGAQTCTNATTTYTYDETGQILTSTDACGNATCSDMTGTNHTTTFSYANNFDSNPSSNVNAYLYKVTNPLGQFSTFKYAYADGQLIQSIDPNNQSTSYLYNDSLRRMTETDYPDTGKTTIAYNDAPYNPSTPSPSVTVNKAITSSANITTLTAFDGMGHTIETLTTPDPDCGSGDRVDTHYDGLGRIYTVSNPYCVAGESTSGTTTYTYDALGRITQATHPDNSTILTSYTGRATQVQDEGNGTQRVTRISQVDGLGRLTSLCEVAPGPFVGSGGASSSSLIGQNGAPTSCGLDISGTGFLTTYQYDGLDDLLQANQGTMAPRTFAYDSLSRLTQSVNPETNTSVLPSVTTVPITYSYDANGNLSSKTAPAPNQNGTSTVATSYTYDALNRLTTKSYSDGTTPTASFVYDSTNVAHGWTATNPVGRLVQTTAGCAIAAMGYDSMGRITSQHQELPPCSAAWTTQGHSYQYDLLGDLTTASLFGAGYTYTYNGVARLSSVTSSVTKGGDNSPLPTNILSGAHYNALGQITSDTLGYGESESWTYNKRRWLTSHTATSGSNTLYSLTMSSYAPNGDVLAVNDSVNGNWNYSYDQFNRLVCANLASNGTCATPTTGTPTYTYVYDRFGNRWQQNGAVFRSLNFTGNNPTTPANTNRIDGYSYDTAGNVIGDGTLTYTYDAENRLISVTNASGSVNATYIYDGSGRRAAKTGDISLCGYATTTNWYLYDNLDRAIAVTDSAGTAGCHEEIYAAGRHLGTYQGGLVFSMADWLGTERFREDTSGTETCTSLPFGDNLTCSVTEGHYQSPIHFTGKERDSESGLDNFEARYNSSSLGRFMSPDPANAAASVDNPQSWNAYSYVLNNPLKYVDPHGLDCIYLNDAGNGVDHIKAGDCVSETDNGYYVDSKEGTVTSQDVSFSKDNNTIVVGFSSENDLPGLGHFQQFCTGSCPDNSVTVSVGLGDPIPTTMSAQPRGLMPTSMSAQQIVQQAGFDFWKLTPAQRSQISSCLSFTDPDAVMGGGPVPFDSVSEAEGQKAAQVQNESGQGLTYRNGKPIIPNIKGAKRAGGVSGAAGAAGALAGAAGCVQSVLQ